MSKIHIICSAYERVIPLRMLVDNFIIQTNPDWLLNIVYDGPAPQNILDIILAYNEPRATFIQTPERMGEYGNPNRKMMLEKITGADDDYVLLTNEDNQYVPAFVEYFLRECQSDVGFVYCNTIHNYMGYETLFTELRVLHIDLGSFIVRLDVAKKIGFNHSGPIADGVYAEECVNECRARGLKIVQINKSLFIHN